LLATLQCQRLRNQFAQDHVQTGDQDEGDPDGDPVSVDVGVRDLAEKFFDDVSQERFADPAQSQAE